MRGRRIALIRTLFWHVLFKLLWWIMKPLDWLCQYALAKAIIAMSDSGAKDYFSSSPTSS